MNTTRIYNELVNRKSSYVKRIDLLVTKLEPVFKNIEINFPNYTHHDISHSKNVLDFMTDLLPQHVSKYTELLLYTIFLAALLHDVGMGDNTVRNIEPGSKEQDNLRKKHPQLSSDFVINKLTKDDFGVDQDGNGKWFQEQLGLIVHSHGESVSWIMDHIEKDFVYRTESINFQFVAFLLRLADALDYDATRAPFDIYLSRETKLPENSKKEWKKQQYISNTVKIRFDVDEKLKYVFFNGRCDSPELYRSICGYFENTLEKCIQEINDIKVENKNERIRLKPRVDNQIKPVGFDCADLHYLMDYKKISNLLMGEQLYQDKKIALRELIQNAIDAALLKKHIQTDIIPTIKIRIQKEEVIIEDNGIGMTEEQIRKYFLNIGNSYFESDEFISKYSDFNSISHYGIGFLSCFMLSDEVIVKTSSFTDPTKIIELNLTKGEKYAVLKKESSGSFKSGTQIILNRNTFKDVFPSINDIKDYLNSILIVIDYEISISEDDTVIELKKEDALEVNRIDISKYLSGITCKFTRLPSEDFFYDTFKDFSELLTDDEYFASEDYGLISRFRFEQIYEDSDEEFFPEILINDKEYKVDCFKVYPVAEETYSFFKQSKQILSNSKQAFEKTCEKFKLVNPTYIYFYDKFEDFQDYFDDFDAISNTGSEEDDFNSADEDDFNEREWIKNQIKNCDGLFDKEYFIFEIEYQHYYFENKKTALLGFKTIPEKETKFFVRNIFVNSNEILLPYLFKRDFITNFEINVLDRKCMPDVTRSKLDKSIIKEIGYAIARGILLDLYETGEYSDIKLSSDNRKFLKGYIDTYFSKKNNFCF